MAKKILMAEDDKPIATALELKLTNEGYDVTVKSDGAAAYEAIKSDKFDIVLLDLIMPEMDGFEVLEKLQKEGVKQKIVVLSNLGQDEDKKRAKELGALDYLIKSDTDLGEIVEYIKSKI